jgi:hypothetical protein
MSATPPIVTTSGQAADAPPDQDPGHLLPEDEWARVCTEAEAEAERHPDPAEQPPPTALAARPVHGPPPPRAGRAAFPSVTGFVQCRFDGGGRPGPPTFGVLHDAETPLKAGYASSIANYFSRNTNSTSAHFMVDPVATIQMLDTNRVAWHCGNGNPRSIGVEQAGYAKFGPPDWTTPAGLQQMARVAALMHDLHAVHGIGVFWMSDDQLRDAHAGRSVGGWATHHQCARVLAGTVHSDPDPNYPYQQLMGLAAGAKPAPPQPTPPILQEDDDMPIEMPAGDHDYVLAVRPNDKVLKLVAFQGNPVTVNMINAMRPNGKGDVDGIAMAGKFDLPRFHGPTWNIPDGCTAVVINYHSDQPISATLYG